MGTETPESEKGEDRWFCSNLIPICLRMENLTIDLKTVMGSDIKRTPFIILISENNLKLELVVQVMLNKMLVKVLLSPFTFHICRDHKHPVFKFMLEMGQVLVLELLSPVILSTLYSCYTCLDSRNPYMN